jgi:cyclopropane fatty-acyl-phospholipid synthase-like methyltransferase
MQLMQNNWEITLYWLGAILAIGMMQSSYPEACQTLATHLADRLQLKSNDRVLDLGCGQGASLLLWQQHYHVQQLCAVELQAECVQRIQHT